ncbi:MAG: hypothetical protein JW981_08830 [Anaerolineae bacterium]|nr:hypothetical protein [Anaerolineae bacterium]
MKLLVILGDGGHTTEMVRLLKMLGDNYDYHYMVATSDRISEGMIPYPGPIYHVQLPMGRAAPYRGILRITRAALQQVGVWFKARPHVILSSGANIVIPIALFGKIMGSKIIHIETGSRVYSMSATGKFMYRIANLFFVQWEPLKKDYPKAIFAGRLL